MKDTLTPEDLQKMKPSERLEYLKENAYKMEEGNYFKRFSPEELLKFKEDFIAGAVVLMNVEDDFARVKSDYKGRIDERTKDQEILLKKINLKGAHKSGIYHLFPDYENGIMYIYDDNGEPVDMLPIKPEERQLKMVALNEGNG